MATDIEKVRKTRSTYRRSATKLVTRVEDALKKGVGRADEGKLKHYEDELKEKLCELKETDKLILDELIGKDNEEAIDKEMDDIGEYKEKISTTIYAIENALGELAIGPTSGQGQNSEANDSIVSISSSQAERRVNVRLPKLELKRFSGKIHEFQEFWDSFQSAIHDNENLSKVDKFKYLRSFLEEPAKSVIAGMSITDADYETAIKLLKKRFGKTEVIQRAHINQLINLTPVYNEKNISRLRTLHDQIEAHFRGLEAQGVEMSTYSSIVVPVLMEKIPEVVRFNMIRATEKNQLKWALDDLLSALEKELEVRESHVPLLKYAGHGSAVTEKSARPKTGYFQGETATSLFVGKDRQRKCVFCTEDHPPEACENVKDTDQRKCILRKFAKCFACLNSGHRAFECKNRVSCRNCKGKHHVAVCHNNRPKSTASVAPKVYPHSPDAPAPLNANATSWVGKTGSGEDVALQTALAKVKGVKKECTMRILFDTGSHKSFIAAEAVDKIGLPVVRRERLGIQAFGSKEAEVRVREIVDVCLAPLDGRERVVVSCYVVDEVSCIPNVHPEVVRNLYPHLKGIWFSDVCRSEDTLAVDILIGSDAIWEFQEGTSIRGGPGEPVAVKTKLGWVLSGPLKIAGKKFKPVSSAVVNFLPSVNQGVDKRSIEGNVNRLWDLETLGIRQDDEVHETIKDDILFTGNRYSVGLPWKIGHNKLPSNYENCVARLQGQIRKFKKDPLIFNECNKIITEQLENGVIEQVVELDEAEKVHYLPSQTVVRAEAETTKVRLVFDASCKDRRAGTSLNDCLHAGPSLTPFLFDILLRFREYRVALVGDIEKAFLNIEINPVDRDCLRFLWVSDINAKEQEILVYRYRTVVFGVRSSPFLLNAVLQHHIKTYQEDQDFVSKLLQSFYVDDLVSGCESIDKALELYQKAKERMLAGGFKLRKWKTNDVELLQEINKNESVEKEENSGQLDVSYAKETLGSAKDLGGKTKVLGLVWDSGKDEIEFDFGKMAIESGEKQPTKRNILSTLASLFDPLGLISPIGVSGKVLFQELCKDKLGWDDPISEERSIKWKAWQRELGVVKSIVLPRCVYDGSEGEVLSWQLHGFGDASKQAYCAIVYLVCETTRGIHVSPLSSKTRVAPLKGLSIPRLELLSARILAVLMNTVYNALKTQIKIDCIRYWLDSMTALYWIFNNGEWKQWVQYRVSEILKLTNKENWGHVEGTNNPADIGSRGVSASHLRDSQLWWNGPSWLKKGRSEWPRSLAINESEEVIKERKKVNVLAVVVKEAKDIGQVIDVNRYSTFEKLLRVTAIVLRFIRNLKNRKEGKELERGNLSVTEIRHAEKHWVQQAQLTLKNDVSFKKIACQLNIIEIDGVYVCKGRLENVDMPIASKYPIYLPKDNRITELIIIDCHRRSCHCGVKATLAELRSRFWVPKGRQQVKKVLRKCVVCKKLEGRPFNEPQTAPLPEYRVNKAPPFSKIGVDFAGPLYVKQEKGKMVKCYICLFSCCVTRALHLELVKDLSAPTFLNCLRRFCARRGTPDLINSDNAKTFKSTAKLLKSLARDPEVVTYLQSSRIEWKFNLEVSPWQGGHFERLIGCVKRCLRKVIGNARLSYDELSTVLTEIECILNSRPLTYSYSEFGEEVLTPSHLIFGRRLTSLSTGFSNCVRCDDNDSQFNLSKRFLYLSRTLSHFWNRWRREYLPDLREAHRMNAKSSAEAKTGDVVLIQDDNVKRGMWKMGIVEEVIKGKDGYIRGAKVRKIGKGKPEILNRPLQKLFPLEIVSSKPCEKSENVEKREIKLLNASEGKNANENRARPCRAAAQDARWKSQLMLGP